MARYIDANELFDEIKSLYVYLGGDNVFNKTAKESVLDCIDKAPTADVVEVVRCKDCVFFKPFREVYSQGECEKGNGGEYWLTPESFCSRGERKPQKGGAE